MAAQMTGSVHSAAQRGFSAEADAYVRGRPAYGADTLEALEGLIGAGGWVGDVGAGAGALSALLDGRGHTVVAVEPVRAMLDRCPPGPVRVQAAADALPFPPGVLQAVTVATAFHWFSTHKVLDELRRCLRPDGVLILLWNDRDTRVPWVAEYVELVEPYAGDAPRFKSMRWRQVVDAYSGFDETAALELPNPTPMTRKGLADRVMSTSFIAALPPQEGAKVRAKADVLASSLPDRFEYPYITRIWAYRPS